VLIRNKLKQFTGAFLERARALKNSLSRLGASVAQKPTRVKVALLYLLGVCLLASFFIWNAARFSTRSPVETPSREQKESYRRDQEEYFLPEDVKINFPPDREDELEESNKNSKVEEKEDSKAVYEEESKEKEEEKVAELPDPVKPVEGGTVKVEFGAPLKTGKPGSSTQVIEFHRGVDIAVPKNTPVSSLWEGEVKTVKQEDMKYGKSIKLMHRAGKKDKVTFYGNLSQIKVNEGDSVSQGEVIGTVEKSVAKDTSLETPHLHLELHVNGSAKNPLNYLPALK